MTRRYIVNDDDGARSAMDWSSDDLEEALRQWKQELVDDGKTPLTIATYVRDARAFLAYLSNRSKTPRSSGASSPRPRPVPRRRGSPESDLDAFVEVGRLYQAWTQAGSPPQRGIAWSRDKWTEKLPEHVGVLDLLPDRIDRDGVRGIARRAREGPSQAVAALVASLVWGFGSVGYGPYRLRRILATTPQAAELLQRVALTMAEDGPVAAYDRLAGDCRLKYLGAAFGTKYLAFCQPADQPLVALIHDQLVSSWLDRHGRPDLASTGWSVPRYEAYLAEVNRWAKDLGCEAETLEFLMFQAIADERGNQWSE